MSVYFFIHPQPNNIGPARQQPRDWGSLESGRGRGGGGGGGGTASQVQSKFIQRIMTEDIK